MSGFGFRFGIDRKASGASCPNGGPSNLVAVVISQNQIDLTFTPGSDNQDGFRAYISTDGGINYTEKGTSLAPSYSATGLTDGVTYYFYVVAYKGSKESSRSNVVFAITNLPWLDGSWFLAGNEIPTANCMAGYTPKGAASLALSYVNQNSPGTHDAAPYNAGDQPLLDADGWDFDGDSQYLTTDLVPPNDQTWSMFIKFSGYTSGQACLAGCYNGSANAFFAQLNSAINQFTAQNGRANSHTKTNLERSIMINRDTMVLDGYNVETFLTGTGTNARALWIGCINAGSASQ